ncbi:hypothetical protein RhiLY_00043 [Ceratobasidium sp. AG-Ba]|nr:hypothetical protein RhiLY_00043 [Ceratobasidium sp. AG-Ba]
MPRVSVSRTRMTVERSAGSWHQLFSRSFQARQSAGVDVDSTSRTLIIVGVVCGTFAALILIGILVYLVIRQRNEQGISSGRIRNGYSQTRTSSAETYGSTRKEYPDRIQSGYKYDPESAAGVAWVQERRKIRERERLRLDTSLAPPKQSSLMQSATSPPPFAQYHPARLGQPIKPHAELRVGDTPVAYVPPAPPSWASIWPTESGWTGPGGDPSIRDEDFGESDDESVDPDERSRIGNKDGQVVLDTRPSEHTLGPFNLSPFRGIKRKDPDVDTDEPTTTITSPLSPQILFHSPQLDDNDEPVENTRLITDTESDTLERSTTGNFTLAFGRKVGRSGTARSGMSSRKAQGEHSRTPSSVPLTRSTTRVTRSSTTRTARSDTTEVAASPVSTVSGQILSALTGRLTTPLLKSVESLGRVGSDYIAPGAPAPEGEGDISQAPVRRLPAPPIPPVPPLPGRAVSALPAPPMVDPQAESDVSLGLPLVRDVPAHPIPRHYPAVQVEIRPLPPPVHTVPRAMSLGPGQVPLFESHGAGLERSGSESAVVASVRPLPVLPVARS